MFDIRLRGYSPAGVKGAVIVTSTIATSIQESGTAALEFAVSERVAGAFNLPMVVAIESSSGGAYSQPRNGLFIVTEEGKDNTDSTKTVTFTAEPYVPWLLEGMHQRMNAYTGSKRVRNTHEWPNATPGRILRSLIDHGKSVDGWAPMLTVDFTATADSAGVAWTAAERWSPTFQDLVSIREVFDAHVNAGLIDWWTEGTTLRVFRPGTGVSLPNVKLGGPGFSRMPVRQAYASQFNYLTVIADDGAKYYTNPGADETYGRRHMTATLSGVKLADADRIVQPMLVDGRTLQRELSYEWTPVEGLPIPWVDFQVGDGVKARTRDGWAEQRVIAITITKNSTGVTVRATVGSKLLNRLKRAVEKITGGSLGDLQGGTGVTIPVVPPVPSAAPLAPGNLRVVSNTATWGEDGSARTKIVLGWDEVTQATDLSDVDGVTYEVAGRLASDAPARLTATDALAFTVEGWEPDTARYVKVRALDRLGNPSAWSGEISVTPVMPSSIVPKAPTGLAVSSNTGAFLSDGRAVATVTVGWSAVTLSVDNTPVTASEYEVTAGDEVQRVTGLSASFTVPSGGAVAVRVRALTSLGVWGDPSTVLNVTGASPAALTVIPSAPILTAGMGGVAYRWDGLSSTGAGMPVGFNRIVVDKAASAAGPWTTLGASGDSGSIVADVGTEVFVRFRAFDTLGRAAGTSTVASAVAAGVALGDIPGLEDDLDGIRRTADGRNRIYVAAEEPLPEVRNLILNPSFEEGSGTVEVRRNLAPSPLVSQNAAGITFRAGYTEDGGATADGRRVSLIQDLIADSYYVTFPGAVTSPAEGDRFSLTVRVRNDGPEVSLRAGAWVSGVNAYLTGDTVTIPTGVTATLTLDGGVVPAGATTIAPRVINGPSAQAAGAEFTILDGVTWEKSPISGEPFSGNASPDPDLTPSWTGAANGSESVLTGIKPFDSYTGAQITPWIHTENGETMLRVRLETAGAIGIPFENATPTEFETYTLLGEIRPAEKAQDGMLRVRARDGVARTFPADVWTEARETLLASGGSNTTTGLVMRGTTQQPGDIIDIRRVLRVAGEYTDPWFQNFTPGDLWLQTDPTGETVTRIKVWNGTGWAAQTLFAEDIFATGSIIGDLIQAGTIEVNHVAPGFGDSLNLEANGSINLLAGRADAAAEALTSQQAELEQQQAQLAATQAAAEAAQSGADAAGIAAAAAAAQAAAAQAGVDNLALAVQITPTDVRISRPGAPVALHLSNDQASFRRNGVAQTWWDETQMIVPKLKASQVIVGQTVITEGAGRTTWQRL